MYDAVEKVLIDEQSIIERCKELGAQITNDYAQKNETPYVVGLLRGSVPFMAELIKHIKLDIQIDFMDVSSYSGTKSLGDIRINKDLECPIQGLSVLLVEDIIDTGRTLTEVIRTLKNKGAKEVKVVSLLDKKERRVVNIEGDYVGFVVPDEFIVGYGLDYDQKYRNLPYLGVLKREIYE